MRAHRTLPCFRPAFLAALGASLTLAGCGGLSLWPFDDEARPAARGLENATEYRCEAGKVFHLRLLDNGAAAWLILPERQVRLERQGTGAYSNGVATLKPEAGTLDDPPAIAWKGCKPLTR